MPSPAGSRVTATAKALRDFAKANPAFVIKAGVLDGKPLTAEEITKLADLESREVLLAKLAGAMQANLSKAVYLIAAPLNQDARALGALERAAAENPALLGGAAPAAPEADQKPDTAEDASATDAAPAAEAN